MISTCGHDERNKYSGGKAGDQTGKEWYIRSWYNGKWNCVIRFPANIREQIALNAERAAKNNLVGYDQGQRTTYYDHLKASNWDASRITIACEADCSAGVSANIIAAGHILNIDKLKNFSKSNTTRTLRNACKAVGAEILTDKKYLTSDKYLLRGDIILKEGTHVITNCTNGSNANSVSSIASSVSGSDVKSIIKKGQQHAINFTGYKITVDGIVGNDTKKMKARVLQRAINLDYKAGISEDGIFGFGSKRALGNHYVEQGEKQYLVTALEILLMLNGIDSGTVELPGIYGSGLTKAVQKKFGGTGKKVDAAKFLKLI